MRKLVIFYVIFWNFQILWAYFEDQPKILTRDGNLVFESAENKNITFRVATRGYININDLNLLEVLDSIKNVTGVPTSLNLYALRGDVTVLQSTIRGPRGILTRVSRLENRTRGGGGGASVGGLAPLRRRITALERRVTRMQQQLSVNNCQSTPCQNGGTCIDLYARFMCLCPANWEGPTCTNDVNECANFAGTELGCQNGATCQNVFGGYNCVCPPGFFGIHCTRRTVDCSSSGEMCGHGTCIQANDAFGYKCICDQGWTTNGVTPSCNVDINECSEFKPHCSKDPEVSCINLAGSYMCGACPPGYTGNGHYCADVNECEVNNGGCSIAPMVNCINTRGSSYCGACPVGFQGDGRICTVSGGSQDGGQGGGGVVGGACSRINCHRLARCVEYGNSMTSCICPPGYTGNGFGPFGCILSPPSATCPPFFCLNGGTCVVNGTSFACVCPPGTRLPNCIRAFDPCTLNPCRNNGTCVAQQTRGYRCICQRGFTGRNCQTGARQCGGILTQDSGTLKFPTGDGVYPHNSRCAWLIRVNETKVINATFTKFRMEFPVGTECKFDWLQIHDGRTSSAHPIGRFCGDQLPRGGNILASQHQLYLWFRSDNSTALDGFEMSWEAVDPICGGEIEAKSHGRISSPGSPGNYPMNRDCYWQLRADPGKRIQFAFFLLQIEAHTTCAYDFLAIHAGYSIESPLLMKYCNTTHPEPLITPSNEATLYFHTDADGTDAGFQITWTVIEGAPGCGGTYTASSGEINSPSRYEDGNYPHNLQCEWVIQLPANSRVAIEWQKFSLEDSADCKFDYVEIFEGRTDTMPSSGRFCGHSIPPAYISQGNVVMVKFKSDWSDSHPGFSLRYKIRCGGTFQSESGAVMSPNYPNGYEGDRTCVFDIEAPLGNAIIIDFEDFDVEGSMNCDFDYVEIFDGHNQNSTSMGRYCGENKPGRKTSTYNFMHIVFAADASISGRGFKANYSLISLPCGGIVKQSSTIIRSPMDSEDGIRYAHNTECRWLVVAPPGHIVQLNWITFDLEDSYSCQYDYVEVINKGQSGDESIGKYCKSTLPPILTSTDPLIELIFKTDESDAKAGFSASVTFLDTSDRCGGNYYTTSGRLRSPGWPGEYIASRDCEWLITVPSGRQIELRPKTFDIERQSACNFDYLAIYNGGSRSSPLIGKFCGTEFPPRLLSFTNQLFLHFHTDASRQQAGFEIEWNGATTGCGGVINSPSGTLTSPNYPLPYGEDALCTWRISISEGSAIQIIIRDLQMESHETCEYDFVEFFDGRDAAAKSLGRFCTSNHPMNINTTSNHLFVRMRTDSSIQEGGFEIRYDTICKRTLSGQTGVIESPNFPSNYPEELDCEWIVRATKGNKIHVEFSHFELENGMWDGQQHICNFDYLRITQIKNNDSISTPETYCNEAPKPFTSIGDEVVFAFKTDRSDSASGFRLEWSIEGCGGLLNRPYGNFSTPNYPSPYPVNLECEWVIQVPVGSSIELTIHDLDLEHNADCKFDGLSVSYESGSEHPIIKYCHPDDKKRVFVGNSHRLFVRFWSDDSIRHRGFKATYRTIPSLKCGGLVSASSGFLYSPNYPQNYDNNDECEWQLRTDESHSFAFSLMDFDLESSPDCAKDVLVVYDGTERDSSKILMRACGTEMPTTQSVFSSGKDLLVVFKSDGDFQSKGFKANFSTNCGSRIVTNSTGTISLSDIVKIGVDNCTWSITADDPSKKVTLTVGHLYTIFGPGFDSPVCMYTLKVVEGDRIDGPERFKDCNGKAPKTIVSNGNAMTVWLGQNASNMGTLGGVDFFAHYSVLDNACGGQLTSLNGEFASPLYPKSYPLNVECIWNVVASPGNKMTISLISLDLQESQGCSEDYLEIREGSEEGRLVGVFCGTNSEMYATQAERYWVKFKSGGSGAAGGFLAEYSYVRTSELYGTEGYVSSPAYPRSMLSHLEYDYRVTATQGSVISIEWLDLGYRTVLSETCTESLRVFDGYDNTSPLLNVNMCGDNSHDSLTSTTNVIYIKFGPIYNQFVDASKFKLRWKEIKKVKSGPGELTQTSSCGDQEIVLSNSSSIVNITSPGYPDGYDLNLNCSWTISSSIPTMHPIISFLVVDLEDSDGCEADYVELFRSRNKNRWRSYGKLCNSLAKPHIAFTMYHGTPFLKLNFRSDYYQNRTGFQAITKLSCGGVLLDPNGVIEERIGSAEVRGSRSCMYNITVRTGRKIEFSFDEFHLPRKRDGTCDSSLTFKNGPNDDAPLLGEGRYCGTEAPSIPQTISKSAFVRFTYGMEVTEPSYFKLKYREIGIECGGQVILSKDYNSTEITSPNYPNIPHPHSECIWTFTAPAGERIRIEYIERFDLTRTWNCIKEYVELRDGGTSRSPVIRTDCMNMPEPTTTTSNVLRVKYFTDVNEPKNGFKARISIGKCGGMYRAPRGEIKSPNYGGLGAYPPQSICDFRISVNYLSTITVSFVDLHLPAERMNCQEDDNVEIFSVLPGDGTSDDTDKQESLESLGVFCGDERPPNISSTTNELLVRFQTYTPNHIYRGFRLKYNISPATCGGEINAPSGSITSPGYPNRVSVPRMCEWRISVPKGRRIRAEITDMDLVPDMRPYQRIMFYNDYGPRGYSTLLAVVRQNTAQRVFSSSANRMMISFCCAASSNRGFKLVFTSDEPTLCEGDLNQNAGKLSAPYNVSSFYCEYKREIPLFGKTLALEFKDTVAGRRSTPNCIHTSSIITVKSDEGDLGKICGNSTTEMTIRSPFTGTIVEARQSQYAGLVNYTAYYNVHDCGGLIFEGTDRQVTSPNFNANYGKVDCAWLIRHRDGLNINVKFTNLDLKDTCDKEFVMIYNGPTPMSPHIGRYCSNNLPSDIISSTRGLFVEYHTDAYNSNSKFEIKILETESYCGGIIHNGVNTIRSPGNGSYPNNIECTWEIRADPGYHIGISFKGRFYIQDSSNCTKDYLELFNYSGDEEYVSLGRVCGREIPKVFNSTGSKMRVKFHTDAEGTGDGFTLEWRQNCGGIFNVTDEVQSLTSPGYPGNYGKRLNCNYTLVAPEGSFISLDFLDFEMEGTTVRCVYDNLTIYKNIAMSQRSPMMEEMNTYCKTNSPGRVRGKDRIEMVMRTDGWTEAKGWSLEYSLDKCGARIDRSQVITLPVVNETNQYSSMMRCLWNITAPRDKNVVVRFEKIQIEHSDQCHYDYVDVYRGEGMNNGTRLARLCGNLTGQSINLENNTGHVLFQSDSSNNHGGFSALILFMPRCDEKITLTRAAPVHNLNVEQGGYMDNAECHYLIQAPAGKTISAKFDRFHVAPCANATDPTKCQCDFLEIRDGFGPFAQLIGRFCGHDLPKKLFSSGSSLWMKFSTDSAVRDTGFDISLKMEDNNCPGDRFYNLTSMDSNAVISNNVNRGANPSIINCLTIIEGPFNKLLEIEFLELQLNNASSDGQCLNDRLEITDERVKDFVSEGLGEEVIFRGRAATSNTASFFFGQQMPGASHIYCGSGIPSAYLSQSNKIYIRFSSGVASQGQLTYRLRIRPHVSCRNYTRTQGRIYEDNIAICTYSIIVPESYTITLFFRQFYMFAEDNCRTAGLKIYDGSTDRPPIDTFCGYQTPDPVFSTTNRLYLTFYKDNDQMFAGNYDITYLATDQGRGCGGRLYNYGGQFSSPLYPNNTRVHADCRWDVMVPSNVRVALKFAVFDLGANSTCSSNYVQIVERDEGGEEKVMRRYCGGDEPEVYRSTKSELAVKFHKTVNADGTGWIINFMGVYEDAIVNDW